ncbi:MAG: hypothetical protein LC790_01770 [Actinobacteria bacterium]|nr:hypothetical protein [Actinomycetota bacterium]
MLLAAAALPGCGGSDDGAKTRTQDTVGGDQRSVLETIDALQSASRRGDGDTICTQVFTPQLARSIKRASRTNCPTELRDRLYRPGVSISVQRGIKVQGDTATAVIREQNGDVSTLHMLKRGNRWQIDRITPGGAS